ncbi:hypothetical protein PanWU01x14_064940 [Parasponia andersonii]|uniref:Transmembrane protein n=1 Tax=Parasponia andersonii TaxID=3476 RepID=A0A2P5DGN4_PARAD|nr:hypothetical protein PanWU01x14_064940 [Parasponia andersonii]
MNSQTTKALVMPSLKPFFASLIPFRRFIEHLVNIVSDLNIKPMVTPLLSPTQRNPEFALVKLQVRVRTRLQCPDTRRRTLISLSYSRSVGNRINLINFEQTVTVWSRTGTPTSSLDAEQVVEEGCNESSMKRLISLVASLSPHVKPFFLTLSAVIVILIFKISCVRICHRINEERHNGLSFGTCIS